MSAPAPPRESRLTGLACTLCSDPVEAGAASRCPSCEGPLAGRYELSGFEPPEPSSLGRSPALQRWAGLLPIRDPERRHGPWAGPSPWTPLPGLRERLGLEELLLLQEGCGPTGSASVRGLTVATAAWAERGAASLTLASAGPSAGPAAAAARHHGLPVRIALPTGATPNLRREARLLGARVVAVLGDRGVAADWVASHPGDANDRIVSAFEEPHRLDGMRTLAFELWERTGGRLPDALVVPTGSGLEVAGLHLGFRLLGEAGLLEGAPPRLVAAQVEACAPIVRALADGTDDVQRWEPSHRTLAESLRDPAPRGARLVLEALRESGGAAVAVSEGELVEALRDAARTDGVLAGAEGSVALAALARLRAAGELDGARVACLDPEAPWRSPELLEAAGTG